MGFVNTSDLKPGQIFSAPVYTVGKNMLVPENVPLRQKDIDLLVFWKIENVRTDGTLIDADAIIEEVEVIEEAEAVEEFEEIQEQEEVQGEVQNEAQDEVRYDIQYGDMGEDQEEEQEDEAVTSGKTPINFSINEVRQNSVSYRAYKNLVEKINSVFTGKKSGADIQMHAIENISDQLLKDLRQNPESFVGFILGAEVLGLELAKSAVNTAILSALLAQELHLPPHKINNIIAGALLHDIGMLRLSKGITEKKGSLSDAELEQIKSHPGHSSKIVSKELFGPSEVTMIALQHHERWDGQGYPDQLAGEVIDLGARIVSVADAFEAMVSKKSYRNSMVGYQAIKNLLADNSRRFDPAVIKAFTKIMGIYPIGSIVRLNNGSIARIINIHIDAPLRPIVQMLVDENGNGINSRTAPTINLLEERKLFIKEAINPDEFESKDE